MSVHRVRTRLDLMLSPSPAESRDPVEGAETARRPHWIAAGVLLIVCGPMLGYLAVGIAHSLGWVP